MKRACVRLMTRSFRVVVTGFCVFIGIYVIIMHRVTQHQSRDTSTTTVQQMVAGRTGLLQFASLRQTDYTNVTTLRNKSLSGFLDNTLNLRINSTVLQQTSTHLHSNGDESSNHSNETSKLEHVSVSVLNGSQSSSLLAGTPRPHPVYLSIGIPTLKRQKGDYFFGTLSSLLNQSSPTQQQDITLVVILADRDQSYNAGVLTRIKSTYRVQLESGLLLVISAPDTEGLFGNPNLKRTFNDSLQRVRWRSKQNLDYAALMEFCIPLSTYYLQIEDDVLAAPNYVQHIQDFVRDNSKKQWAGLEVCPHGFIGKLFRSADLHKLVAVLRVFYLEMPCDFLIHHFYGLMLQTKVIRRKGTLFFHQGKYSSLGNVTRKIDRIPGVKGVSKTSQGHTNPSASLYTTIRTYKRFELRNAYNPLSNQYFWGVEVEEGDSIIVVFLEPVILDSIVIETGFPGPEGRDKARNATLEVGQKVHFDPGYNKALCTDTKMLGEFKDGRFEAKVNVPFEVKCVSMVITKSQHEWLVVREIAIYKKQTRKS